VNIKAAILLSTFNGADFLAEQLDSLLRQNCQDFIIVVRDDGSTDGTQEIIESYRKHHPEQIHCLHNQEQRLGACQSFATLLAHVVSDKSAFGLVENCYYAFCDQDDVWHVNKLALTLAQMQAGESGAIPCLVHSDLKVVDQSLQQIAPSLVRYQGLQPSQGNFGRALVANSVTGCTLMINEPLARMATPIPTQAVMHDWWLALVAAAFGSSLFLDQATMEYRQHQDNKYGAIALDQTANMGSKVKRLFDNSSWEQFASVASQSGAFLHRYSESLSVRQKILCRLTMQLSIGSAPFQKLLYRLLRRL